MPNDSGLNTPHSTAPTSPTSPTSTNGLIDCEKGHTLGNQDAEWDEKKIPKTTGQFVAERMDS